MNPCQPGPDLSLVEPLYLGLAIAAESGSLRSAAFTAPVDKSESAPRRVTVRAVSVRGSAAFQFEWRYERGAKHVNVAAGEVGAQVRQLFPARFARMTAIVTSESIEAGFSVKGLRVRRRPLGGPVPPTDQHDRAKSLIIPAGTPCPFLQSLGIMASDGSVHAAKYAKFRQINRFLELVRDELPALEDLDCVEVVDLGCGKGYLTFALRHYLAELLGRKVHVVGIDLRPDVIATCSSVAGDLGLNDIEFRTAQISEYASPVPPNLVVALHACDTASDDALGRAVGWGSRVIMAAPCCQHELRSQLDNPAQRLLLKHNLLRERLAALVTDAARAALLERAGYRVQMVEFVDPEHTPKNVLIRAVKRADTDKNAASDYDEFKEYWGITPALERAPGMSFSQDV